MIKGGCHSGRKVVPYDSKSYLPLANAARFDATRHSRKTTKIPATVVDMYVVSHLAVFLSFFARF